LLLKDGVSKLPSKEIAAQGLQCKPVTSPCPAASLGQQTALKTSQRFGGTVCREESSTLGSRHKGVLSAKSTSAFQQRSSRRGLWQTSLCCLLRTGL